MNKKILKSGKQGRKRINVVESKKQHWCIGVQLLAVWYGLS